METNKFYDILKNEKYPRINKTESISGAINHNNQRDNWELYL